MITDNLTNTVYFSGLLPEKCPILNAHITEALQQHGVSYAYLSETKDIWCRDFMPIQIENDWFVFYKYTPDYLQDKNGSAFKLILWLCLKMKLTNCNFIWIKAFRLT